MVSQRTLILECGTNRVSAGVFSCAGLRLSLQQLVVENFPLADTPGANGEEQWLENVRLALHGLRRKTKYRGPAILVLPAHLCLTKFVKVPRVDAVQREKILRFEAEQNIPYALSDVVWGSVAVSDTATETDVLLAAAKLEVLDVLCDAADAAGFKINTVSPAQCATLAGFRLVAGTAGKCFLGLNVGERATTLVLVESGRFALRSFAVGTNDNAGLEIAKESAAGRQSEPLIAKLQQEIARSLLHFQWRTGMTKPERVYVAGSGVALTGLVEAVGEKLKIPAVLCDLREVVDQVEASARSTVPDGESVNLIDLAGAAATCFDRRRHAGINLLPPRMLEHVSYRRRRPWLMAAAIMAMTILLPPVFHFTALREEAVKKSMALERELAPLRVRDFRIQQNLRQISEIRERVAFYRDTDERRDTWIRFLAGMQTQIGAVEDVWLEKIQLAPPTVNAPMKLLVSGRMLDRTHPLAKVSAGTFSRVNALLNRLAPAPFVAAVESEHFDHHQPGVLQFDFVLVTDAKQPL